MCKEKIKHTCGGIKSFASCVSYEKSVPAISELFGDDCKSVEEVIEDLYKLVEKLKQDTDVSEILNECITLDLPKTTSSVVEQMYLKICELEQRVDEQQSLIENLQ